SNTDLSKLYDHFIEIKHSINQQLQKMIQQILKDYQLDINQYHDLFLLIASLSTLSYSLNNIAESIIEEK
uniref:hypothetical protein n=1 Tax=Faecalibacillus intestinalis TaxID=1982626 RepID=UPI00295F4318